jgi:D-glycero-alpha-D-manno-heptose 1-phosphate guanylyltransferase
MQNLKETTAAILAGGLGTRLRSVVSDRQKVMATVGEKPFVIYLLDELDQVGIGNVVLCVGYLGDQVQGVLGSRYKGIELFYSREPKPLGTGGALRFAHHLLRSEQIMILNGDSFCQVDLNAFWNFHMEKKSAATMLLVEVADTSSFGKVEIDAESQINGFSEKCQKGNGWVNAGLYLIQKILLETLPTGVCSIEKDIFPQWVGKGLLGYCCHGKFLDIGTPSSYSASQHFFNHST